MRLTARIGVIEFAGDDVRAAVVKTGGKLPVLCEAYVSRASYSDPSERFDALVLATKEAVKRIRSKPNAFVLCADGRFGVVRSLTVPLRGRSRVAAAVRFELEPYLAFPIEELIIDHNVIREVDGQTEVLTVGMRKAFLEESLRVLVEAGIDPDGIGIDAAGLTALWLCGQSNPKGLSAVLHVRENGSVLAILYEKTLCFFRYLSLTPEAIVGDPRIAARDVTNSLRSFLASWKAPGEFERLTVTGLHLEETAREIFENNLPVAVSYADLSQNVRRPHKQKTRSTEQNASEPGGAASKGPQFSAWDAAIGVALGAAGAPPAFNFRQGDLAPPRAWQSMVLQGVFTAGLAAVLLVSYALFCYVDYRRNAAEIDRVGAEIWALYAKTFPLAETAKKRPSQDIGGVLSFKLMEEEFKKSAGAGRGFNPDLLSRPTLLEILAEVTRRLSPDKVLLSDLIVRSSNTRSQPVTIMGELKDPAAIAQEYERLKESPLLKVTGEPTVSSKPDKTTFTIVASTQ